MLAVAAAVSWRLLLVGLTFYAVVLVLSRIPLVVVPTFAALLISALLYQPVAFLRRHRWPRMLSTWVVLLIALAALGAVGVFVVTRGAAQYPSLAAQLSGVSSRLQDLIGRLPGVDRSLTVDDLTSRLLTWLGQHRTTVAGGLLTVGRVAGELITGLIIAVFLTYFFVADGDRIWSWMVRLLPATVQPSVNGAGHSAWRALSGWIAGTAVIALIHGVVIGTVLWLLGTPLVVPLAVLVFIGSFIPVIGALLFGGVAALVTLVAVGPVPALILVAVLLAENQLEAHLLQPFIIGRAVNLHPVAIVLVLTGAGTMAGVIGAIVAIPLVASVHAAMKYLTGVEDLNGRPLAGVDRMSPLPPELSAPLPFLTNRDPATRPVTESEPEGHRAEHA